MDEIDMLNDAMHEKPAVTTLQVHRACGQPYVVGFLTDHLEICSIVGFGPVIPKSPVISSVL